MHKRNPPADFQSSAPFNKGAMIALFRQQCRLAMTSVILISTFGINQTIFAKNIAIKKIYSEAIQAISLEDYSKGKNLFIELLNIEPAFYPPKSLSPKIKRIFERAYRIFLKDYEEKNSIMLKINHQSNLVKFEAIMPKISSKIIDVILWLKPKKDSAYISYRLTQHEENKDIFFIDLILDSNYSYHYYLSAKGEYGHHFLNLASAIYPKTLLLPKKEIQILENLIIKDNLWDKIQEGWPLILGAGLFIIGAATFSLIKITT